MRHAAPFSILVAFAAVVGLALALTPGEAAAQSADMCIKYRGEVRYGALGYNHLVHITNACNLPADCIVTTDVNPEPQQAEVGGRSDIVVTTFLGSPARAFTPNVKCVMRR